VYDSFLILTRNKS